MACVPIAELDNSQVKKMGYTVLRFSNGIVQKAPELFVVLDAVWSLPEAFG